MPAVQLPAGRDLVISPYSTGAEEDGPLLMTSENIGAYQHFDPLTTILAGRRGRGKTASMTFIGAFLKEACAARGLDVGVWANYNTSIADWYHQRVIDYIATYPRDADNLIVLIDEAAAYFPRRRSLARSNVDFSTFLQQIRKRNIEIVFTTQFPAMLDDQILINVDLYCDVNMRYGGKDVDVKIWDWHGQFTGNWQRPRVPPQGPPTWYRRFWGVNNVFNLYNTREVIGSIWSNDSTRDSIASQYGHGAMEDEDDMDFEPPPPAEPEIVVTDWRSYVATLPPLFDIAALLSEARRWNPKIKSKADFAAVLEKQGYRINRDDNKLWVAER